VSFASSGARERETHRVLAARAKALVVAVDFGQPDFSDSLQEIQLLTATAGAEVAATITSKRSAPDAALFVGSGKAHDIGLAARASDCEMVIVDHALSPAQQRNLEKELQMRVIDRTSLILDIFAQRAHSHEGKIQVELAQLQHLSTRLIRGWTHLERQKGGIGLRGPGETQLETDRRLIGERVKMLRKKLAKLQAQRQSQRRARERRGAFSVSLIGYTNAGKSTLFNALTKAASYAADQLFATLDTTTRRIWIEGAGPIVISDTVGFIRDLPHSLIEAFKATLEETIRADLLLHVIDAANPAKLAQIDAVNQVLAEIGADDIPQLLVFNKSDLAAVAPGALRDVDGKIERVFLSAKTGAGLDLLRNALKEYAEQAHPAESFS
jgi:GTP-binding protein HflX